jgi:hypothetical protein
VPHLRRVFVFAPKVGYLQLWLLLFFTGSGIVCARDPSSENPDMGNRHQGSSIESGQKTGWQNRSFHH